MRFGAYDSALSDHVRVECQLTFKFDGYQRKGPPQRNQNISSVSPLHMQGTCKTMINSRLAEILKELENGVVSKTS